MTNAIKKTLSQILSAFEYSGINSKLELILIKETGSYINLNDVYSEIDLKRLCLVSVCRDCYKTQRYRYPSINNDFHKRNLEKLNKALGTSFTKEDMEIIYQYFGNGLNQDLATSFVVSGYNMNILRRYKMKPLFPNLELIEHKTTELALLDKALSSSPEFDLITFPQIWGSTCTGFDLTSDGLPVVSGSAMTKEYTTVAHELKTDVYYIFFGGRPCYKVTEAGKNFFSDLNSRNMASLSKAKDRYIDQKYKPGEEILTIIAELRGDIEELHSLLSYEFYCEMRDKIDEIETLILEVVKP